jgi:hypothetical protein
MQSIGRDGLDSLQLIIQTRHATKPQKLQRRSGVCSAHLASSGVRGRHTHTVVVHPQNLWQG